MIQQTPWVQRKFDFDIPIGLFPIIFSRLEGSLFRLNKLLQTAEEEQCSRNINAWSVKEHIGHLYDLEDLWWKRLNDFHLKKEVLTAADMSNAKTHEARHNEKTLGELFQLFTKERQKILETIYDFDKELLLRTSVHPRLKLSMRLIDSLYFVAEHDDHHIAAISGLLRLSREPA
jgi:uncharacterized damage-inducible protein DinB